MHNQTAILANLAIPACDLEQIPVTDLEFERFLKDARGWAYRMARSHLKNEDIAHDVIQNAMIELMKCRARRLLPAAALGPMFNTIVKRCIFAQFKIRKRRAGREILFCDLKPNTEDQDGFDFLGVHEAKEPGLAESSANVAERNEVLGLIDAEIRNLPDHLRKAFLMRYAQEMDISEIAESMGRSSDAIKNLYRSARKMVADAVRDRLGPACPRPAPVEERQVRVRLHGPPKSRPAATVNRMPRVPHLPRPARPKFPMVESMPGGISVHRFLTHDVYNGDATALVAAGVIEDGMLPGRAGRPKKKVTIKFLRPVDGVRYIQLIERAPGHIEVRKAVPNVEADRRCMLLAA
ncbi:sigma-70 family RNA polymerase sigma factor [Herbaspirillum sp. HC18]|nr:sigma-70 family RNA polymerase sigma factor [Herbaspirillum sp. HC18]